VIHEEHILEDYKFNQLQEVFNLLQLLVVFIVMQRRTLKFLKKFDMCVRIRRRLPDAALQQFSREDRELFFGAGITISLSLKIIFFMNRGKKSR